MQQQRQDKGTGNKQQDSTRSTMKSIDSSFPARQVSALKDKDLIELPDLPVRDQWFSTVHVARLEIQIASATRGVEQAQNQFCC